MVPDTVEDIIADVLRVAKENPFATWGLWMDGMGWYTDGQGRLDLHLNPQRVICRFYTLWQSGYQEWRPRMVEEWLDTFK